MTDFAASHGIRMAVTPDGALRLQHAMGDFSLEADSRQIRYNSVAIWLNEGIRRSEDGWAIAEADADTVLAALVDPDRAPDIGDRPVIVIDPGHGGQDAGTRDSRHYLEKRLNLDIARRVQKRLSSCGIAAVLTRQRDVTMELEQRAQAAAACNADGFVSIHMNSAANRLALGIESYMLTSPGFVSTVSHSRVAGPSRTPFAGNGHGPANMLLAYDVHRGMLARTGAPDRGIRHARFEVLRNAPCPAVLVECGFLSNTGEASRLASSVYQDRLAEGIAQGILTYVSRCQTQSARRRPPPAQAGDRPGIAQTETAAPAAAADPSADCSPQCP
jgi:N-acetylmuramoyl-L-alanine amidase